MAQETTQGMDKWQAVHSFWNSFDIPAYDEASVPDDATMPYITYSASTDSMDSPVALTGSIWYRSLSSWGEISRKAEEINNRLKCGGVTIPVSGGYLWIVRGTPFAQRGNEGGDTVKHIYIVLMGEFLTE